MDADFTILFKQLRDSARLRGLSDREWAAAAGVRPETLCRMATRTDCDFQTLAALARVLDFSLALDRMIEPQLPERYGRAEEERLVRLCASGTLDVRQWLDAGPRRFMAGLALLMAGRRDADREALVALAAALDPAILRGDVFQAWLDKSSLKPSRFFPLLDQRRLRERSVAEAR